MTFTGSEDDGSTAGRRRAAGTIVGFALFTAAGVLALVLCSCPNTPP